MSEVQIGRVACPVRRVAGLAMVLAAVALSATAAAAMAPTTSGWWTELPLALAPDAPEGSLVVESGVDSRPVSFAALSYRLEHDGEQELALALSAAPGAASTPGATLTACLLTEDFSDAAGAPMSEAPEYTCDVSARATASTDGTEFLFDLEGFAAERRFGIAILADGPLQRVVIESPGPNSLRTDRHTSTANPPAGDTSSDHSGPAASSSPSQLESGGATAGSPTSSGIGSGQLNTPAVSIPAPAADDGRPGDTSDAGEMLAGSEPLAIGGAAGSGTSSGLMGVLMPAAAAAGVAIWLAAGRRAVTNALQSG